jgi:hypothetical protein
MSLFWQIACRVFGLSGRDVDSTLLLKIESHLH